MAPDAALAPAPDVIRAHLEHITRRWTELGEDVLLEVVFLTAADQAEVRDPRRFRPDRIEEAAQHVAAMNRSRLNAYAVVNPVRADAQIGAGKRASREHIAAAFFHWADADDARAADNIRGFVGPKCTFSVMTGTQPCARPHVYWELEEPTRNLVAWEQTQRAIAATLGTDPAVVDPPRIMRLAGTVNWPKPKKQARGYVPEVTTLRLFDPADRPPVSSERMARAFAGASPLSARAAPQGPTPLDRDRATIQALSGQGWHDAVIRLVGSYVRRGLSDAEIHTLTDPLTLAGYTVEDTRREVQEAIDGARRKGWTPEGREERWEPSGPDDMPPLPPPEAYAGEGARGAWIRPEGPRPRARLEWFDDIEPVLTSHYLIKGVLDAGAMSVVYGPSNSGKTFLAMDMAYHLAIGASWRGYRARQAAVLYLAAEGGAGAANRIAALRIAHGVCDVPFALRRAGLDLLRSGDDLDEVLSLAREVQGRWPDLPLVIVVDTLSRVMAGGDENAAADMTALIRNIDTLRQATGAHLMIVHHSGKDAAKGARGHSSLRAATDTEIEVQAEEGVRAALVTKQRDNPSGQSFGFILKSIPLGVDEDGDEVTSCIVEPTDEAPQPRRKLGPQQRLLLDTLDQMTAEPGRFRCVRLDDLRAAFAGKTPAANPRDAFKTAFEGLRDERGLICMNEGLVWRVGKSKADRERD